MLRVSPKTIASFAAVAVATGTAMGTGCSSSSSDDNRAGFGGSGATPSTGGTGGGAAGSAGAMTTGGTGGTGGLVGTGGSGGTGGAIDPDAACTSVSERAENKIQPADIIIAIDQSGSMDEETQFVQQQINGFANQITAAGIDVYVAMIAVTPGQPRVQTAVPSAAPCDVTENPLCVPVPLAAPSCADNLPLFKSVNCHVDSRDALRKIVGLYDEYRGGLRPDSQKHVIAISDDDSNMPAAEFDTSFRALDAQLENYAFHAIVAFSDPDIGTPCNVLFQELSAREGEEYRQLVQMRGGIEGDLCLQNFQPIWDAVSQQVVTSSTIACEWDIPPPSMGSLDPTRVNVEFIGSGMRTPLGFVEGGQGECGNFVNGWYYDDNANPTQVFACPDTCQLVQGEGAVEVNLQFGCATELAMPR